MIRYAVAAAIALALAAYVTAFALQTHNRFDLPTGIDVTEWPATLAFLIAAVAAWRRAERPAALAVVVALLCFVAAQGRFLFDLPLAFLLVGLSSFAFLLILPVTWRAR